MDEQKEEQMLTVPEAAREANVTPQAIRNAIYEGKLTAQQVYGRQIIARSDFDRYLAEKRGPGRPPKKQDA